MRRGRATRERPDVYSETPTVLHCMNDAVIPIPKEGSEVQMKKIVVAVGMVFVVALSVVFALRSGAQAVPGPENIHSQQELEKAVIALDSQLFDAFNHCDLTKFASLLDENVEFYHDQGGLTLGREKFTESVKNNICTGDTQRVVVPGTLKIYPMKGYGAIEMGVHRFVHPKTEAVNGTGEGSFVNLWQYKDGAWKLTRALSYDHHAAK